jgi:uncharacterized Zn-binding protein involved in type VI secretion
MSEVKKAETANVGRAVKATHWFATIGSLTEQGGRVTGVSSGLKIAGLTVALVDDVVTYEDGSEAVIIDGAGVAAAYGDRPIALVGSRLSNGDRIIESLQNKRGISEYHNCPILGPFDPAYTLPTSATTDGATINA